jgi:hypothetical protein
VSSAFPKTDRTKSLGRYPHLVILLLATQPHALLSVPHHRRAPSTLFSAPSVPSLCNMLNRYYDTPLLPGAHCGRYWCPHNCARMTFPGQ